MKTFLPGRVDRRTYSRAVKWVIYCIANNGSSPYYPFQQTTKDVDHATRLNFTSDLASLPSAPSANHHFILRNVVRWDNKYSGIISLKANG